MIQTSVKTLTLLDRWRCFKISFQSRLECFILLKLHIQIAFVFQTSASDILGILFQDNIGSVKILSTKDCVNTSISIETLNAAIQSYSLSMISFFFQCYLRNATLCCKSELHIYLAITTICVKVLADFLPQNQKQLNVYLTL